MTRVAARNGRKMKNNLLQFVPRIIETPKILICTHCGAENDGAFNFCSHCGKALRPQKRSTKQKYAPLTKHTKVPLKTMQEIVAMEAALQDTTRKKTAYRNLVLFRLGCNVGLRGGDLVQLKAGQFINRDGSPKDTVYVVEEKTNKGREMSLESSVSNMVAQYTDDMKLGYNDYLFASQKGGYISRKTLNDDIIIPAAEKLGWNTLLYGSHTLRKTYAYRFYTQANALSKERGYRALSVLCRELGHSSEAITLCYIGIDREEIKEICALSAQEYDWAFAQAIRDELNNE